MNLAGGQKLVTILFIFLAPLVLTHTSPWGERCPAVFHKCTSLQVSQVHKWKCQNIRLVRAREVVNALQMQSIRRWIYFLAKGSFWPKTAKCRRELCTSNESSLCYILDLHSNHGGLAIVIVTIIHHIYFQFHCHDHQPWAHCRSLSGCRRPPRRPCPASSPSSPPCSPWTISSCDWGQNR